MALASLTDVKRILRIPPTSVDAERDANLRAALDAIESWASRSLKGLTASGSQVETYFDIYEDATLHLPGDDIVVTKVTVWLYPSSEPVDWFAADTTGGPRYQVTDDGKLILRPVLNMNSDAGRTLLRCYERVDVFYEGTGVVPRGVTEGIALMAAGYYSEGPQILRNVKSEKIGDYSYTLNDQHDAGGNATTPAYASRAAFFLNPWMRRNKVAVT